MGFGEVLDEETERIATAIVDSIFHVHSELGAGLLESLYVSCLILQLQSRGLKVRREVHVHIIYIGQSIPPGLRIDILVEEKVIVEVKSVEAIHPIHSSQVKTYLKLTGKRLGILVNFNSVLIKDGMKRIIL